MATKKWILLLFVTLGLGATGCVEIDIIDDMVAVDKAYIPTAYYVREGNLPKAKLAMIELQRKWNQLDLAVKAQYENEDWIETFGKIEVYLDKADAALKEQDLFWMQCQLENARFEWNDLRIRYGIDYHIDYMYDFQVAWDLVKETVNDPVLCWLEWQEFEAQVVDADQAYQAMVLQTIDWELIEADQRKIEAYRLFKDALDVAWKDFKYEMECAHREQLAVAANVVTKQFEGMLNLFGDFESINAYVAQNEIAKEKPLN